MIRPNSAAKPMIFPKAARTFLRSPGSKRSLDPANFNSRTTVTKIPQVTESISSGICEIN